MLREIEKINQPPGEERQRWFTDEFFDLFTWHAGDEIVRFQLTYAKGVGEHALTWERDSGYRHHRVDDGEERSGKHKASPILVADGPLDGSTLAARFAKESTAIDQRVAALVIEKIRQYGGKV